MVGQGVASLPEFPHPEVAEVMMPYYLQINGIGN